MKFEGCTYYTSDKYSDASLIALNGAEFEAGDYVIAKTASTDNPDSFEVTLSQPAKESLTFSFTGNRPCVRITLYTANSSTSGIEEIEGDTREDADDAWYTLQGIRLDRQPSTPGLYIHNGRKIFIRR